MKAKENIRNSNHELMRIISMNFIVLGHVLLYGNMLNSTNVTMNTIYKLLEYTLIIHVPSFVLLTGYYQSKSSFKQSKVWQILNEVWFYKFLFLIIFLSLGLISLSKVELIKELTPFPYDYWYIKCYLLLFFVSPFLNKLINSLNQKEFKKLIVLGFFIFCVIPALTGGELFENDGYTLYQFIYLYFVGAYLRLYPLEDSYIFKKTSKEMFKIIMIIIFFSCIILNFLIYSYGVKIADVNNLFSYISNLIGISTLNYSSPIITIQAIAYFSFFTTISIKSKFINSCSALTLGVYIIHENIFLKKYLYGVLGFTRKNVNDSRMIINVLLATIIIYIICSIIEWLRQRIFQFIYNRNISKKIRNYYYQWLHKLVKE